MNSRPDQGLCRDEQLGVILAAWLEAAESGNTPDSQDFLRRYPDFAEELAQHLADWAKFPRAAGIGANRAGTPTAPLPHILGDYELLREIGRGGMGIVYEARQISLDRRVALKILPFAATMDAKRLQRFHHEARAAAALEHPHIVPVYGVGSERGVHYYAMRLIDGQTLAALIAGSRVLATPNQAATVPIAADTTEPPQHEAGSFRRAAEWVRQAAEALEHAHALGIVHRDIKPANLIIDTASQLWITDFGLARTAADTGLTMTGDLLGTLRYMSPEQALAKHGLVDHRTDVYALGATLYELTTGHYAVEGDERREILHALAETDPRPPSQWNRAIPAELETIILKALAKEPAGRYASSQEMADDLANFLEDRPIQARRPSRWQRTMKWRRRHRTLVWSAAVSAILICATAIAALAIGLFAVEKERQQTEAAYAHLAKEQIQTEAALVAVKAQQQLTKTALNEKNAALSQKEIALRERQLTLEEKEAALKRVKTSLNSLARSYHDLGYTLAEAGNPKLGEKALTASLQVWDELAKRDPDDPQFRCGKAFTQFCHGIFLQKNGKTDEAEQSYRQALDGAEKLLHDLPENKELVAKTDIVGILNNLSILRQQKNDPVEALHFLEKITLYRKGPIEDFDVRLQARWIHLLRSLESHPRAVEFAKTALAKAPKNNSGPWQNVLGVAYYRAGDYENSLKTLESSRKTPGGENGFNYFPLAMVHWRLDHKAEAKRCYDQGTRWMQGFPQNNDLNRFHAEATQLLKIRKAEKDR